MTKEQAKEHIKEQLESYLQGLGKDTSKAFICLNPEHHDKKPSMSYDRKRNKAHCFSCGADYDTLDIISIQENTDTAGAFRKAYEIFNISIEGQANSISTKPQEKQTIHKTTLDNKNPTGGKIESVRANHKEYIDKCKKQLSESPAPLEYLHNRGLSKETIARYNLGYDTKKKQLIIPYDTSGGYYIARNLTDKAYYKATGSEPLYNLQALYNTEETPVFVTEGQLDALSIIEAGAGAIALNGTGYVKLINQLKKKPTSNTLILSLDNDKAGEDANNTLQEELKELKVRFYKVNVSGECKDPNEALTKDRGAFMAAVKEAQESTQAEELEQLEADKIEYEKNNAHNYIKDFLSGMSDNAKTTAIATGFKELDNVLYGGLYEGLYIIGAISSLGKTTFVLQIADQIAQQEQDVLIFSLEMARTELMAKSISKITFLECKGNTGNAKTTRGISAGRKWIKDHYEHYTQDERNLLAESIEKYSTYAKHIYISEGLGSIGTEQIKEEVKKHIIITGKKPVVIIDYLQILAPADIRSTDKQNTDKSVMELKRISRDYKIPVIGVSSLNRENYNAKISMTAFKESGAIEYSSDVLIGLQFQAMNNIEADKTTAESIDKLKNTNIRKIELKILKNRNGQTSGQINYDYYPQFNYFEEVGKAMEQEHSAGAGKSRAR